MYILLDTREAILRTNRIIISDEALLGWYLNWMMHVKIYSRCIAVWFCIFFLDQPWECFQVLHLCAAFDVTAVESLEYPGPWNYLKSFKEYLLPPSNLCRCLLPADSSTKWAVSFRNTHPALLPCPPPSGMLCSAWQSNN